MIEVKNLVKEFKSEDGTFMALDDLSFKVNRGEIFGVIGLSETGKSTLVRCINRLEEPTSGRYYNWWIVYYKIKWEGTQGSEERYWIDLPIFYNIFMQKAVTENIVYPLEISGVSKSDIENRVDEFLNFINLKEKKNSKAQ